MVRLAWVGGVEHLFLISPFSFFESERFAAINNTIYFSTIISICFPSSLPPFLIKKLKTSATEPSLQGKEKEEKDVIFETIVWLD